MNDRRHQLPRGRDKTAPREYLSEWCRNLLEASASRPKEQRFRRFAASLPADLLKFALEGAEAYRQNRPATAQAQFARALTLDLWALVHDRATRDCDTETSAEAMINSVGMALTFEHLRRLGVVTKVPSDPFSRWELRSALNQLSF